MEGALGSFYIENCNTCDPSTGATEAGGSKVQCHTPGTQLVWRKLGLQETLSQITKEEEEKGEEEEEEEMKQLWFG